MADLLSYQGNAGLGIGSNADVPVVGKADLNQVQQAARDIMLKDDELNVLQWKQKISDRDAFRDLVDRGQIAKGDILPEYQPVFDRVEKKVTDYFQANGDQLLKDPEKYREYQNLVTDAKDAATHAQVNTKEIRQLEKDKASASLPADQERIQKHIDTQKSGTTSKFWDSVMPYQKMHSMSIDEILKVPDSKKTSYVDPNDPFKSYDTDTVDYGDILRFKQNQYINDKTGEAADSMDQFYNQMQQHDPTELGKTLSSMDNQIERYNKERGFTKNSIGYVEPVRRAIIGGQLVIQEPKADFAAKYALANQSAFVTKKYGFNEKVGTYLNARERISADAAYKRIMAGNMGARTRAYADNVKSQIAARKKPEDQVQFMDEMYDRNLMNQDALLRPVSKLIPGTKGEVSFSDIDADSSLPVLTLNGGKVEKLIPISAKQRKVNNKIVYEGGHYEPQYIFQNKKLTEKGITDLYSDYKKTEKGKQFTGDINDFIKRAIQDKAIDFLIKGANGTVDRKLSLAVQRAISNQVTGKGETGIFDSTMPADEQIPDSQTPIE